MALSSEATFEKRAPLTDQARAARLRAEAAVLQRLAHPGVVELVEYAEEGGDAVLRTVAVTGRSLAEPPALDQVELATVLASVATTLADLHELGVAHGRIVASRVLLDDERRPVLCGLGAGMATTSADQPAADDVASFGAMAHTLLERAPASAADGSTVGRPSHVDALGRVRARLQRAPVSRSLRHEIEPVLQSAQAEPWTMRPTARHVADRMWLAIDRMATEHQKEHQSRRGRSTPGPTRRGRAAPAPARRRLDANVRRGLAAAALLVVAAMAVGMRSPVAALVTGRRGAERRGLSTPRAVQTATSGPAVLAMHGMNYEVGGPGDQVVAGRFDCQAATAAVLTPAGGVFIFDRWADDGEQLPARHLRDVGRGSVLRTEDTDNDGCDEIVVRAATGADTVISPRPLP